MKTHSDIRATYFVDSKSNGFVTYSKRDGYIVEEKVFTNIQDVIKDLLRHFNLVPIGCRSKVVDAEMINAVLAQHENSNLSSDAARKVIIDEILK